MYYYQMSIVYAVLYIANPVLLVADCDICFDIQL